MMLPRKSGHHHDLLGSVDANAAARVGVINPIRISKLSDRAVSTIVRAFGQVDLQRHSVFDVQIPLWIGKFDPGGVKGVPNRRENRTPGGADAIHGIIDPDPKFQIDAVVTKPRDQTSWPRSLTHARRPWQRRRQVSSLLTHPRHRKC